MFIRARVALEKKKTRILDKFLADELSNDDRMEAQVNQQLQAAQEELEKLNANAQDIEAQVDYLCNFMGDLPKLWSDASLELKQKLQRAIMPEGVMYRLGVGYGTPTLGPSYAFTRDLEANNNVLVVPRGVEPRLAE
jgi:hypothetical protein